MVESSHTPYLNQVLLLFYYKKQLRLKMNGNPGENVHVRMIITFCTCAVRRYSDQVGCGDCVALHRDSLLDHIGPVSGLKLLEIDWMIQLVTASWFPLQKRRVLALGEGGYFGSLDNNLDISNIR
jgi:hypothetical protein